jgi:type II secretion system protein D
MTPIRRTQRLFRPGALVPALVLAFSGLAVGQPAATDPEPAPLPASGEGVTTGWRRPMDGPPTVLAFKNVTVEQLVPFIVESTGKVVMPQADVMSRKLTILNDQEISRASALDLVFLALQQSGVGVVETSTTVTLRDITEIDRQDVPVLGPGDSVMERTDLGSMAEKVFTLRHSTAENFGEVLKDSIPKYAKLTVDKESNQLAILGNIALLQRMERLIGSLDRASADSVVTETFRLRYADAATIATNIKDLFADTSGANARGGRNTNQDNQQNRMRAMFGGGQEQPSGAQPTESLRVTANTQQNSVTVMAEPVVLEEVRRQIEKYWDQPLPDDAVVPRIYDLKNSDPVKLAAILEGLFGQGTPTSTAAATGGPGGGQASGGSSGSQQGIGRLAGQFSFQAVPESGRLIVVSKTPDNMAVIDPIIRGLDQPQTVGLPEIIELKHAQAEELAEQLNTLLALDGTLAQIRRSESGLTGDGAASASPFAQDAATTDTGEDIATTPDMISFWWQRSRPPTDEQGSSNLVGRIRLVPVWRQNAVMVLSPPEYRASVVSLIESLDKPGRQVLIAAIIAEVSRDDATELGLRWGSGDIASTNPDNALAIGLGTTAAANDYLGNLFDTSVLNVNANLNVILQALSQKTSVNILSEPRIFTSDNQEAEFFDGQDIPFVTDSQTTDAGNTIQSFDYRAVGIQLRARPRITVDRKVDLEVNLELSSIVPGLTFNDAFIVNRRETTTQLIVQNGQTVVISGILRSEKSNITRKVPLLGDIPILGWFFTSIDEGVKETELLVFITPLVQDNVGEAPGINDPYMRQLDAIREDHGGTALPGVEPGQNAGRLDGEHVVEPAPDEPPPTEEEPR